MFVCYLLSISVNICSLCCYVCLFSMQNIWVYSLTSFSGGMAFCDGKACRLHPGGCREYPGCREIQRDYSWQGDALFSYNKFFSYNFSWWSQHSGMVLAKILVFPLMSKKQIPFRLQVTGTAPSLEGESEAYYTPPFSFPHILSSLPWHTSVYVECTFAERMGPQTCLLQTPVLIDTR